MQKINTTNYKWVQFNDFISIKTVLIINIQNSESQRCAVIQLFSHTHNNVDSNSVTFLSKSLSKSVVYLILVFVSLHLLCLSL